MYQAKQYFYENYYASGKLDLDALIRTYKEWVSFDEYYVLKKKIYGIGVFILRGKYVKSSKRGNDVYNWRVDKRFSILYDVLSQHEPEYEHAYVLKTDILFFTLTYAFRDIFIAYENVGKDYNRFMSNLRKIFPRAKTIARCFQAQRDGTVHIHALIWIGTHLDVVWYCGYKNGHKDCRYIVKNYDLWLDMKNCWKYGNADIRGFVNFREGLKYIFRYVKKGINLEDPKESLLTLSLNWLFHKKSFYINYKFIKWFFGIRLGFNMHSSNSDLVAKYVGSKTRTILRCIGLIIDYEFVGVFSKKQLNIKDDKWFYDFNEFPEELINICWGKWETPFF